MGDELDTTSLDAPERGGPSPLATRVSPTRGVRRRRVRRFAGRALVVLALLWVVGALTRPFEPPFVQWREHELPERPDPNVLPELELVELDSGGRTLRGWYVPADPGAPVVLHLMGSGLSVFDPEFGFVKGNVGVIVSHVSLGARQLADAGFASLALDYGGVGRSEGSRSMAQFRKDVRAMWVEALRRVDGIPARVILRGVSLGTLAAGLLLEDGARPRALLLHTPVLAETVVGHFTRGILPVPLAALVLPLLGPGLDVDLCAALGRAGVPTYFFLEFADELLPTEEALRLARFATVTGGASFVDASLRHWTFGEPPEEPLVNHVHASLRAAQVLDAEAQVLAELGSGPDASWRAGRALERTTPELRAQLTEHAEAATRSRLEALGARALFAHPDLLVAAALAGAEPEAVTLFDETWPSELPSFLRGHSAAQLVQLLDLRDPAGDLPVNDLKWLASALGESAGLAPGALSPMRWEDARELWNGLLELHAAGASLMFRCNNSEGGGSANNFVEHALLQLRNRLFDSACREDARGEPSAAQLVGIVRRAQRLILKTCGVPDRLTDPESPASGVQALVAGTWRDVDSSEVLGPVLGKRVVERFLLMPPKSDDVVRITIGPPQGEPSPPDPVLSEPWWVANRRR